VADGVQGLGFRTTTPTQHRHKHRHKHSSVQGRCSTHRGKPPWQAGRGRRILAGPGPPGAGFRAWREPARWWCAARRWMRGSRSGTCSPASCSRICAPAPRLATRSPPSGLTSWRPRSTTNLVAPRAGVGAPSTSGLGTR
jgi:hypothetical protein